ncbi:MAG: hypothetical protein ACOCV1_05210 [Bacillota bacterium]
MKDKIFNLAYNFRKAIEFTSSKDLIITLQNFPKGSCGDASLLLARYLQENDISPIYYTYGIKSTSKKSISPSHAWLKYKDLIIDITANQFDEISKKVIVTTNNKLYSGFKIRDRFVADYRNRYNKADVLDLDNSYKQIIKNIDKIK